jgi:hypothetical protein
MKTKLWNLKLCIMVTLMAVLLGLASGCSTAKRGEATTATAGHSPILQMQNGVHFYTSNTRPIQAPEDANERPNLSKFSDTLTLGDITVTTTTTISSGTGNVETAAADTGDQTPTQNIQPSTTITP